MSRNKIIKHENFIMWNGYTFDCGNNSDLIIEFLRSNIKTKTKFELINGLIRGSVIKNATSKIK